VGVEVGRGVAVGGLGVAVGVGGISVAVSQLTLKTMNPKSTANNSFLISCLLYLKLLRLYYRIPQTATALHHISYISSSFLHRVVA